MDANKILEETFNEYKGMFDTDDWKILKEFGEEIISKLTLCQPLVISTCQPEPKICDCKRKDDYTAKFICDGNCK